MEGNGSGLFDLNTSTVIDDNGSGTPDYAIICDLDQDGDQDLLVSLFSDSKVMFYENTNPVGTFSSARALVFDRVGGGVISFQSEIWTEIMTWILLLPIKPRMKWYGMRMTGPPIFHLVEWLLPHWTVWISPDTLN